MHTLVNRIKEFNKDRLPDMLQLKYEMMTENMFRFYRGTCHLFYEDLSNAGAIPKSPVAWICGDLHLENFGSYKGDNRLTYFDLNDFDEAILAPASYELLRIVTSILLAFETLKIEKKKALNMAQLFLRTYAATLARGKAYYIESQTAKGIVRDFLAKASRRKQKNILKKRTERKKDQVFIQMDHPRHFDIPDQLKRELSHHLRHWIMFNHDGPYNYDVLDVAFRLAGTGSVGLKRYVFLLQSVNDERNFIMVDMKQATESSLAPYIKVKQPEWATHAERIVEVQQRMQNIPPALLSTTVFQDDPYLIQEMQPTKDSINFNLIKDQYRDIYQVIDDMAMLTASSQLRSTGRQGSATADDLIAFGQDTTWQQAILDYAIDYSKKVKDDYKKFRTAFRDKKFE